MARAGAKDMAVGLSLYSKHRILFAALCESGYACFPFPLPLSVSVFHFHHLQLPLGRNGWKKFNCSYWGLNSGLYAKQKALCGTGLSS